MGRPRTKRHLLVENAACFDVPALLRAGLLVPGRAIGDVFPVVRHPDHRPAGAILLRTDLTDENRASQRIMFGLPNGRSIKQEITIVSQPRAPFGGRRWFFLCPQTGARACRLYLPRHGERFLSREAYGLRYAVEHDTALD